MKAEILSRTDWLMFPLITVVLFTAIFVMAVLWVYRPGAKELYARASRMVLEDGEVRREDT